MEERATFENRATLFCDQSFRRIGNGAVREPFQVGRIDIYIPLETLIGKTLGKQGFMQAHRIVIVIDGRNVIPVIPERLARVQTFAICMEMRLNVLRQIGIRAVSKRIVLDTMEFGDAPEIQIPLVHCFEHFRERIHRSHDGGVE